MTLLGRTGADPRKVHIGHMLAGQTTLEYGLKLLADDIERQIREGIGSLPLCAKIVGCYVDWVNIVDATSNPTGEIGFMLVRMRAEEAGDGRAQRTDSGPEIRVECGWQGAAEVRSQPEEKSR